MPAPGQFLGPYEVPHWSAKAAWARFIERAIRNSSATSRSRFCLTNSPKNGSAAHSERKRASDGERSSRRTRPMSELFSMFFQDKSSVPGSFPLEPCVIHPVRHSRPSDWPYGKTQLDRDVAIKVLSQESAVDTDRRARFEREAKAIATLSHPNILAIFNTGEC